MGREGRNLKWLWSMCVLFVMRFCMSINFNAVRNIYITDYTWNVTTQKCIFQKRGESQVNYYQVPIYVVEFFLPVLGGLAVDKWFGELKVLRVAGVLLLISGIYVTAVDMGNIMCQPVVYLLGLIPSCLAYGIGVAPLAVSPLKLTHGRFGSPTPGLVSYYTSAALGEVVGFLPRHARPGMNLNWIVCISPIVYIAASVLLRLDWTDYRWRVRHQLDEHGFMFPTRGRLMRYFLLLAPLVLLVSIIGNVRCATYCIELNYYLNCSGSCSKVSCAEVFGGYNSSTIVVILLLGVVYKVGWLDREGSISCRFYIGVSFLLLSKAALIPWHCWAAAQGVQPDPKLTHAIYGGASVLDGVANGLAMASGYELLYRIAPAYSKNLVMGVLYTIWGIGALSTGLTILLMTRLPHSSPVLKPVFGESNILYAAYVFMVIEAVMVLIYYRYFSQRLISPMMTVDDCDGIDDEEKKSSNLRLIDNSVDEPLEESAVESSANYGTCST